MKKNTNNNKRVLVLMALVCSAVSLSACDALRGDPNGDDCHINENYEIRCEGTGEPGLQTP